jgi:hypothetical protein
MKNKAKVLSIALFLSAFIMLISFGGQEAEWKGTIEEKNGVKVIKNPKKPLKGMITLDIEKIREIDPYQHEEVGMSSFYFTRDDTGEVILYDSGKCEAHRFSPEGEYLGNIITKGQGPGEFMERRGMKPFYWKGRILVASNTKLAWFTREGEFISEQKLKQRPHDLIDENRYISTKTVWQETGRPIKIFLVELTEEGKSREGPVYFKGENVGMLRNLKKGFGYGDAWTTPNFNYRYNPFTNRIIGGLNKEYKIYIKDISGKTETIIQRSYQPVHISTAQKKELCRWKPNDEYYKWILSVYPNTLVAIRSLRILPKGYLAVSWFSGIKESKTDIFNQKGEYLYIVQVPEDIPLARAKFYDFGFSTIVTREDMPIYVEYRIKNLPEIFKAD